MTLSDRIVSYVREHDRSRPTDVFEALDLPEAEEQKFIESMRGLILSRQLVLEFKDAVWSDVIYLHAA